MGEDQFLDRFRDTSNTYSQERYEINNWLQNQCHLNIESGGTLAWALAKSGPPKGSPGLSKLCHLMLVSGVTFKKNLLNEDKDYVPLN